VESFVSKHFFEGILLEILKPLQEKCFANQHAKQLQYTQKANELDRQ